MNADNGRHAANIDWWCQRDTAPEHWVASTQWHDAESGKHAVARANHRGVFHGDRGLYNTRESVLASRQQVISHHIRRDPCTDRRWQQDADIAREVLVR